MVHSNYGNHQYWHYGNESADDETMSIGILAIDFIPGIFNMLGIKFYQIIFVLLFQLSV